MRCVVVSVYCLQVMQIWMKCKERGYCLPKVYQGVYNPIARQVETEILPCCRMLNMRFVAYVLCTH